ncbi:MAG: glycosyltransferase family 9 protein [Oleiphilaceae bacterium]|nr:glycosyltransferase family 9 protein [Oleiphilaceae bacterium]
MTAPSSICILRLSAIGDVCNAVAAVQAIQAAQPQSQITWIIGKLEYSLLEGLPGVEFIVFDKRHGKQAFKDFKQQMRGRRFDVLLHMQVALRANWLARLIPAKRKIGFDKQRAKELHSLFINERIRAQTSPHVLEGFFAFAEKVGVAPEALAHTEWRMPLAESDLAFAAEQLPNRRTVVIVPAASNKERNWLPERYAAVADHAHQLGFEVVLCGGPSDSERELERQILQTSTSAVRSLIGRTTLKQLQAVLTRAALVIAPDTGPAHMANAAGTPVLGLYGHANPTRTGPWRYRDWVVEVYHQHVEQQRGKPANALPWGVRVKGEDVMASIEVSAVCERFDAMVQHFGL